MKLFKSILLIGLMAACTQAFAHDNDDLRSEIARLQAKLEQNDQTVDQALDRLAATQGGAAGITLARQTTSVAMKGDLRLRYSHTSVEADPSAAVDNTFDALSTRFRLGVEVETIEDWTVAFGLTTGTTLSGSNPDDIWNTTTPFDKSDLVLDYAYAMHQFSSEGTGDTTLMLGQMPNPFETTFIVFDEDVRPTGIALNSEMSEFFVTVGAFEVFNQSAATATWSEASSGLLAGQIGHRGEYENMKTMLAVAYYWFTDPTSQDVAGTGNPEVGYQLLDVLGKVETSMEQVGVALWAEYVLNTDANSDNAGDGQYAGTNATGNLNPDDEDEAYGAGIELSIEQLRVNYAYAAIGNDAAIDAINDNLFGNGAGLLGVDVRGHVVGLEYDLTRNMTVGGSAYMVERQNGATTGTGVFDDGQLYLLDLTYRF